MLYASTCAISLLTVAAVWPQAESTVGNPGFEDVADGIPDGWSLSVNGGPKSTVAVDETVSHSGVRSLRITSATPIQPMVWTALVSSPVAVEPGESYSVSVWARMQAASQCYVAVAFSIGGEHRMYLPGGGHDWREYATVLTAPPDCRSLTVRIACDDVTASLWADDVSLTRIPLRLAGLKEQREKRPFEGVFPRSARGLPEHLVVMDATALSHDERIAATALQGLVNRDRAQLYLIQPTNPAHHDELWLEYMREKGHTGEPTRVEGFDALLARFGSVVKGVAIYDPELPGTIHAACALAGIDNVLPASPTLAERLAIPVLHDLRGRWRRNVDAYRFIVDTYWDRLSHHVLAWLHPNDAAAELDYRVQHNVFAMWQSGYGDPLPGADPAAEELFIHEILGRTPGNVPVMGWPSYAEAQGITEYQCVRLCSEYGKFLPGFGCSNLSVHTAIRPPKMAYGKPRRAPTSDPNKVYIALSVLESGDALWYWQLRQREVWADPARGRVPVGWCMNPTLPEVLPVVAQWYAEHLAPGDTFFAAPSGIGYMLAPYYATRFVAEDRERIWREYVAETDARCRRAGMRGLELHTDGVAPDALRPTLERFVSGMRDLKYILNDFTRFPSIDTGNAAYMVGDTAVFHTLTRYKSWTLSTELAGRDRDAEVAYLLDEIRANTPAERPAFMSAMVTSWTFFPSWIEALAERLPPEYEVVNSDDLAELYRDQHAGGQ